MKKETVNVAHARHLIRGWPLWSQMLNDALYLSSISGSRPVNRVSKELQLWLREDGELMAVVFDRDHVIIPDRHVEDASVRPASDDELQHPDYDWKEVAEPGFPNPSVQFKSFWNRGESRHQAYGGLEALLLALVGRPAPGPVAPTGSEEEFGAVAGLRHFFDDDAWMGLRTLFVLVGRAVVSADRRPGAGDREVLETDQEVLEQLVDGRAAGSLLDESTHDRLGSSADLTRELLDFGADDSAFLSFITRASGSDASAVASIGDDALTTWVMAATTPYDMEARSAKLRGFKFEVFHFGLRLARVNGTISPPARERLRSILPMIQVTADEANAIASATGGWG